MLSLEHLANKYIGLINKPPTLSLKLTEVPYPLLDVPLYLLSVIRQITTRLTSKRLGRQVKGSTLKS